MVPLWMVVRLLVSTGLWKPAGGDDLAVYWHATEFAHRLAVVVAFYVSTGPFYYIMCESSGWQATFGKRLMRIHVADDKARRISGGRAAGRWFAEWVCSLLFLPAVISFVTAAATHRGKALHDYLAGTIVLSGNKDATLDSWRIGVFVGLPVAWILATFIAVF